jgi:bifunctional non-homologous end joining protein LigD
MENITLYFRQGSSDKIYQAGIQPKDGGYVVTFAYGRRGSTLSTGTKTQSPVSHDEAKAIYDKLVQEKTAKGYTPGADGTPYQGTDKANATTGIHCQLLNPVEEDQLEKLIEDPAFWMQEKWDGRRLLIRKQGDTITGINRLGLAVALPQPLHSDAKACPVDFIIAGEAVGDMLTAFDVLLIGDEEIGGLRYAERHLRLMNLLGSFQHPAIHLVETHFTAGQKREAFDRLKSGNREGVVFKHTDAPYISGRPASGGSQLKYKFCETASFIVGKVNGKRSVSLMLHAGKNLTAAGNVTIPPNHEIPKPRQIVECRYLYAFKESGCIYQPVYLGTRDDIPETDCTTAQLKFKADETANAE